MTEGVKIAFERKVVSVAVDRLLPTRALPLGLHETVKYRRIAASVSEVGLIEPLSVARQKDGAYLLLDGHVDSMPCAPKALSKPRASSPTTMSPLLTTSASAGSRPYKSTI